ncbi:hypothetical protein HYC85_025854 [Camellia sinensis]|uniref:Uncharacterized protein n=1 Tax=Camellia sinensis TaxID=4442 RepID=A0A7J7G327_CAMSI|nr:hypothetical protein HYC85_025854 [Camellia sinensis]
MLNKSKERMAKRRRGDESGGRSSSSCDSGGGSDDVRISALPPLKTLMTAAEIDEE